MAAVVLAYSASGNASPRLHATPLVQVERPPEEDRDVALAFVDFLEAWFRENAPPDGGRVASALERHRRDPTELVRYIRAHLHVNEPLTQLLSAHFIAEVARESRSEEYLRQTRDTSEDARDRRTAVFLLETIDGLRSFEGWGGQSPWPWCVITGNC